MATINNLIWSTSPGTSGISFTGGNFSADVGKSIRVKSDGTGLEFFTPEYGDVTGVTGTAPIVVTSSTGPIPNVTINGLSGYGSANQLVQTTGSAWTYVTTVGTGAPVRTSGSTLVNTSFLGNTSATNLYISGDIVAAGSVTADYVIASVDGVWLQPDGSSKIFEGGGSIMFYYAGSESFRYNSAALSVAVGFDAGAITTTPTELGFFGTTATTKKSVNISTLGTASSNPVLNTEAFMSQMNTFIAAFRALVSSLGDQSGYGLLDTDV